MEHLSRVSDSRQRGGISKERIAEGKRRLCPFEGRKKQIGAFKWLLCERQNLMSVAKKSINKDLVPYAVTVSRRTAMQGCHHSTYPARRRAIAPDDEAGL